MKKRILQILAVILMFAFITGCQKPRPVVVSHKTEPRFVSLLKPSEHKSSSRIIQFVFSLSGQQPRGVGPLRERVREVKIYVFNQKTGKYETIGHDVYNVVSIVYRKEVVVEAIVPEPIRDVVGPNIKFYADYFFDGKRHTTKTYEFSISGIFPN